jgi:hypothetical protein
VNAFPAGAQSCVPRLESQADEHVVVQALYGNYVTQVKAAAGRTTMEDTHNDEDAVANTPSGVEQLRPGIFGGRSLPAIGRNAELILERLVEWGINPTAAEREKQEGPILMEEAKVLLPLPEFLAVKLPEWNKKERGNVYVFKHGKSKAVCGSPGHCLRGGKTSVMISQAWRWSRGAPGGHRNTLDCPTPWVHCL